MIYIAGTTNWDQVEVKLINNVQDGPFSVGGREEFDVTLEQLYQVFKERLNQDNRGE